MEVKDLKPALIWQCFDAITKVPRPSTHEEQIRKFLLDFAAEHNLEARTDKVGNVAMSKGATPGYENAPTVILQAHMDMVAEKNNDVQHDFLKDPIETYIDGSSDRRYQFNFGSREYYNMDRLQNIANSTFYEDFANWVEAQEAAGNFPELPEGMHPEQLSVLSSGYMFDESMRNARYQIQLELIYHKEA